MSLIVVTGAPGSGKTALVVDWLAFSDKFKGRPIFSMGIPELKLPHAPTPPVAEWTELRQSPEDPSLYLPYFTFPPGSVVVLDEAQRVYRPRPVGSKVPPEVAAFETHRHCGLDFILMTQHANFLDANIRKLVGRHVHVWVQPFGRELLEWERLGDVETRADRELASRTRYKPPARVFDLYKSAEVHTKIKRKMPKVVYLVVAAVIGTVAMVALSVQRIKAHSEPAKQAHTEPAAADRSNPAQLGQSSGDSANSLPQYLVEREPRIAGLLYTAPVYDNVTQPTEAPYPAGCVQMGTRCKCIDQQGSTYPAGLELCRSIVADGVFIPFRQKRDGALSAPQAGPAGSKT